MKRKGPFLALLLPFFLLAFSSFAEERGRVIPLPIMEAEEVLMHWLTASGITVFRASSGTGEIYLRGSKGKEIWKITLRPHSPLATFIQVRREPVSSFEEDRSDEMWLFLEQYSKSQPSIKGKIDQALPPVVLSRISSVVCLTAKVETREIQFSGVRVDEKGLILATAHDLKGIQTVTIKPNNGEEVQGTLVKINPHRDLILIDSPLKGSGFVNLKNGKKLLNPGEVVYAVGCPMKTKGTVHAGVVDGPMRIAGGLPLWQVAMDTLPGSSGSPVFNGRGEIVALVKGRFRGTGSIGFLIPLETIIEFINE